MKPARPRIAANFAITADAKISTRNFTPALFTSSADKARLQEIRAGADAIIVGRGTVAADTMSLGLSRQDLRDARAARGLSPVPLRVLVSNAGILDPNWKVFQYAESPLVVFSTVKMPERIRARIAPLCDLHLFPAPTVPLEAALQILFREYKIRRAVCEGGGTLLRSLAEADLVDEIFLTLAPMIFGGAGAPTLTGKLGSFLPEAREFKIVAHRMEGAECFLHLRKKFPPRASPKS